MLRRTQQLSSETWNIGTESVYSLGQEHSRRTNDATAVANDSNPKASPLQVRKIILSLSPVGPVTFQTGCGIFRRSFHGSQ